MVHVYNNALIIMQDDAHDQVLVAFNIWDVTHLPMTTRMTQQILLKF
jgi:hypothetical protein